MLPAHFRNHQVRLWPHLVAVRTTYVDHTPLWGPLRVAAGLPLALWLVVFGILMLRANGVGQARIEESSDRNSPKTEGVGE